jgi:hypothetical protein
MLGTTDGNRAAVKCSNIGPSSLRILNFTTNYTSLVFFFKALTAQCSFGGLSNGPECVSPFSGQLQIAPLVRVDDSIRAGAESMALKELG